MNSNRQQQSAALLTTMRPETVAEAKTLLNSEQLLQRIVGDIADLGIAGESELAATVYVIGTSRLLEEPLAAIVQGPSASGKSYVIEKVASLFPTETVIHATHMTPQALYYMPDGALKHRWIVAGERARQRDDDAAVGTKAIREMISSGRLTKLIPMKDEHSGSMETKQIVQQGPIAYVESTTQAQIFDEDRNRCLLLQTDERAEQSEEIVMKRAKRFAGAQSEVDTESIRQRHHALQRLLQQVPVVVPFAGPVGKRLPMTRMEIRRAFGQLMSMVQASALLHQFQREQDNHGRILAIRDDYELARRLLRRPLAQLLGGRISPSARRFLVRLMAWAIGQQFSTTEAVRRERQGFSDKTVRDWLREICAAGGVEVVEPGRGPKPTIWSLTEDAAQLADDDGADLPNIDDLLPTTDDRPESALDKAA